MTRDLDLTPGAVTVLVTGVAVALSIAVVSLVPQHLYMPPGELLPATIETLVLAKIFFTTLNLVLLLALTGVYIDLYRDLPNKYTRSLLLLSLAFLLYAFTSNPLVQGVFGFHPRPNIGMFGYLPDIFVGIGIVILLYQSQT